jgi:thiamine-phosphate pyrophosphorylase
MAISPPASWNGIPSSKLYPVLSLERLDALPALIRRGVGRVQIRHKEGAWGFHWSALMRAQGAARDAGLPLIINDRADVALALEASGVHVGRGDLPPDAARKVLGPGREIGLSCATQVDVDLALGNPAVDLISIGPIFATPVKPGVPPVGVDLLRANAGRGKPVAAIGGIDASNAREVLAAGADYLAMVRAVEDLLE